MISFWLAVIGTWVLSDAIYSYALYVNAENYKGNKQNWKRDHWVRAVRAACGIALIVIGAN